MFKTYKNIKLARFSYLDVQFVMLQFGVEKHNNWRSKWGFHSLRLEQIEKVLDDGHTLFVKICARNVSSHDILLLIHLLVKFDHLFQIL